LSKLTKNDDYFLIKPMIHFLPIEIMRKYAHKTNLILNKQINVYKESYEDARVLSETNLLGLVVEKLVKTNSGILLKTDKDKEEARISLLKTKELLKIQKQDFQLRSILINNLFGFTLMIGKFEDFIVIADNIIDAYRENIDKKTISTAQFDFLIIIINLSFFLVLENPDNSFFECLKILKTEFKNIVNKDEKRKLEILIFLLELFNDVFNEKNLKIINIDKHIAFAMEIDEKKSNYSLSIFLLSKLLLRLQMFDKVIDLTDKLLEVSVKDETLSSYIFIKTSRAIVWLHKENLELFYSEIESVYKMLKNNKSIQFSINVVNYIKGLAKKPSEEIKQKKIKKLKEEILFMKENRPITEYIGALHYVNTLNIITELGL